MKRVMKLARSLTSFALVCAALAWSTSQGLAQDKLKLAIGQRGNWDTAIPELGTRAGIFKKHGLELEMLYTQGGGETQQAVISRSVDIGLAAGTLGVVGAYAKGAPVRIIGAEATGLADYWYVRADSPIKTLKDTDGKTIAYSTNGSSTHGVVLAFIKENDLKAKPVATGGPAATLTTVMTGQVDVGWAAPPFGLKEMDEGKIRLLARGADAAAFRDQTVRLAITNTETLQKRKDALARFMQAYRETIDWMYSDPAALKAYADFVGIPEEMARRVRDEFFTKAMLWPDEIKGVDQIVADAVDLKYTPKPLSKEQMAELIQIPAPLK
jgi:NitT/TauT family transport system substrate-binding protein